MELFDKCEKCGKDGTFVKKVVIGTFVCLKQTCNNCDHIREWDSQPFMKNIPAGNILLSASILFGGGLPSQVMCMTHVRTFITLLMYTHTCIHTHTHAAFQHYVPTSHMSIIITHYTHSQMLRILDHLGCASISLRTYFNHQHSYLQPTIFSVWHRHQFSLLTRLKNARKKLIVGGDGRADSPGHSAKYGSYTIMELEEHNMVLDMQLVQVHTYIHTCIHICVCTIITQFNAVE